MNTIRRIFARGNFAYNSTILVVSTATSQAISILAAPLLSRLYTPDDFGTLGVFISIFMLLNVISSMRYEYAINLANDENEAANILLLTIFLVISSSVILLIILLALSQSVASWLNAPELEHYIWLIPLSLLGAGVYTAFSYWSLRCANFSALGRTRITQSLIGIIVQLALGVLTNGPFGLLLGHSIAQSAGSTSLARLSWQQSSTVLRRISWNGIVQAAQRYRQLALLASVSALVNTAGAQAPRLLLSSLYGVTVTGWFTFTQRIFAIPLSVLGASIGQVFLSNAAQLAQENPYELRRLFLKTARLLLILGIFPTFILFLFGKSIFAFILGPQWETAGVYTQILAPSFLIQFVVSPLSQVMFVMRHPNIQLAWDILRLMSVTSVFIAAILFDLDALSAISVYTLVLVLTYGILFTLQWRLLDIFVQRKVSSP